MPQYTQDNCTGAARLQSFFLASRSSSDTGHGERVSDCNAIRPLAVGANRPAFKPVTVEESACMDLSQLCQPLYTAPAVLL